MSYTTLYKVPEKGEIEHFEEFGNSHRGAAMLWDYLGRKYVPGFEGMQNDAHSDRVWALTKDDGVGQHEKDVLLSTFDHVMLKRQHFVRVADAMNRIGREMTRHSGGFGEPETSERDGGHYPAHAEALRRLLDDPGAFAACWDQTSVADDMWNRYDRCKTCGQDLEDCRSFDLARDSGHWFMLEPATDSENQTETP